MQCFSLSGEMEDSDIAQLPQALQEEARSLRAENERRQMEQHRNVTEHLQRFVYYIEILIFICDLLNYLKFLN